MLHSLTAFPSSSGRILMISLFCFFFYYFILFYYFFLFALFTTFHHATLAHIVSWNIISIGRSGPKEFLFTNSKSISTARQFPQKFHSVCNITNWKPTCVFTQLKESKKVFSTSSKSTQHRRKYGPQIPGLIRTKPSNRIPFSYGQTVSYRLLPAAVIPCI